MRVTIIRDDKAVIVDDVRLEIGAVALLPANVHAIQWDSVAVRGEIEYAYSVCAGCGMGSKKPNETITQFRVGDTPLQPILDAHAAELARVKAEQEAAKAEAEAAAAEAAKAAEQPEASQ